MEDSKPATSPAGNEESGPGKRKQGKSYRSTIFIPYTRDSSLKKSLQKIDDTLGECLGSPGVRFVERCGGQTLMDLLATNNPWARTFKCGRRSCLPCLGREMLASEESLRPIPDQANPQSLDLQERILWQFLNAQWKGLATA